MSASSQVPPGFEGLDIEQLMQNVPWYRKENSVKNVFDFISAINWPNEKTLQAVIGFHFFLALVIVWAWRNPGYRLTLWLILMSLCMATEKLNEFCSQHYKKLGFGEQYFDSQGLFILLIWAAPLLILLFILTGKMLNELWHTLIETKVKQLKVQKKKQIQAEKSKTSTAKVEAKKDK